MYICSFFHVTATTETSTLSLHDALPICRLLALAARCERGFRHFPGRVCRRGGRGHRQPRARWDRRVRDRDVASSAERDRKSTRLNSSHMSISYAVFCLKKKKPATYTVVY